jgi:hypothetical protein
MENLVDIGLYLINKKAFEEWGDRSSQGGIQQHFKDARTKLCEDDFKGSEYITSKTRRYYDRALYTPTRRWRFSDVYPGPIWIYLVGFLGAVLAFYLAQLNANFLKVARRTYSGVYDS